jgi:hypothetical protein
LHIFNIKNMKKMSQNLIQDFIFQEY